MHSKGILLTKIEFDAMENSICQARCKTIIGIFVEPNAEDKIVEYISRLPTLAPYTGWDKQTYPRFERTEVEVF